MVAPVPGGHTRQRREVCMNLKLNHETPLLEILQSGSVLDIIRLCAAHDPRFLAALVRAHTLNYPKH